MTTPEIHADTQIQDDVFMLTVNQTTLHGKSPFTLPDFIHPHEVEQKVNEFNDVSKDLILEYHYTRIDKNTLTIQLLFKPLFTKLGESQTYAHFRVRREGDHSFHLERLKDKPSDLNLPAGVEPIPVQTIQVARVDADGVPRIQIKIQLLAQVETYKNHRVIIGFVKKLMQSLYDHASAQPS
jgi:hypothetical protein